jgi:MFS family permease
LRSSLTVLRIAPLVINAYGVAEGAVPPDQITETLTWVVAGMPMGGALSSALSGQIIDRFGADIAFWVPLGFMIAACAATLPYFQTYKGLIGYLVLVTELHDLMGKTEDGLYLSLHDNDGQEYTVLCF